MTTPIPAQRTATTRATYDVERDRRESLWTALSLIADGQAGKAYRVLCAATQRCARLSVGGPDPGVVQAAYDEAFTRHLTEFCLRAVARRAET